MLAESLPTLCCCCWVTKSNESRSSIYARVSKTFSSAADCARRMLPPTTCSRSVGIARATRGGKVASFQSKGQPLRRPRVVARPRRRRPARRRLFDDPLKCATLLQVELPNDGDQNAQPDRQACRHAHKNAPPDAGHVADRLGPRPRSHLPADPEIREGHQQGRRQPVAADRTHSPRARRVLL